MTRIKSAFFIALSFIALSASSVWAQTDSVAPPKFKIAPIARALFDVAAYTPQGDNFRAGVAVPDARLGAQASFGDLLGRVEIAYRFGKFQATDLYLQWQINKNSFLRGGYFIHQFGIQSATGGSAKISMEAPIAESALGENRLLGAMYVYTNNKVNFAGSLFAQSSAITKHANELGRTGVGAIARFTWHPTISNGNIFQIGTSLLAQTPAFDGDTQNPTSTFKSAFPTKVSDVNCLKADIDHVKSIFKVAPEMLWAHNQFAAEAQFYYLNVARKDGFKTFDGLGVYALGRVMLNPGSKYSYNPFTGYLATPKPKTWEIVAGYSFTDLDDTGAGIWGGRANAATVTLNYYINKWFTWRLNYAYVDRQSNRNNPALRVNIFQTRIQFVF